MVMAPKGPRANVRSIDSAPKRQRGRPSGLGYDPETGQEYAGPTLETHGSNDPETDVFTLIGQRGYSEDRFYTKSTDARGHGKTLRVNLPQGLDAQVYAAVSAVPEYISEQAFIRDAIVHRLEYIQKRYKISEAGRRFLELERLRSDSSRRSQDIDTMVETVKDLGDELAKAWETKDYAMLAEGLEEGEELIDWMRDPYKGQVKQLLIEWQGRAKEMLEQHRARMEE